MALARGPRWAALTGVALLLAPGISGCGKTRIASGDPAKACASQETTERIRSLLFEKAANAAGSTNRYAVPKLQPQSAVSVSRPLVESYDAGTHKTNCSGVLAVKLPAGVMTVGGLRAPIRYSAQPLADGSGLSFDLSGADEVVAAIAGADLTLWAKSNAQPQPGLVVEVAGSPRGPTKVASAAAPKGPPSTVEDSGAITTPLPLPPAPAPRVQPKPRPALPTLPAPPPPEPRPAIVAKPKPQPAAPKPAAVAAAPSARPASRPVPRTLGPPPPPHPEPPAALRRSPPSPVELARREPSPPPPPVLRPAPALRPAPPPREARSPSLPPLPPSADGPVRVFVHVAGGTGRGEADAVRARLSDLLIRGAPVATPAVRIVARTPRRNEVRCLKAADCAEARRVAAYLARSLPGGVTVVDMSRTYENDPGVRSGSLELWLKPHGAPPAPYGDEDEDP